MDRYYTDNIICRKLLTDKFTADLGYVYEKVVSDCFAAPATHL